MWPLLKKLLFDEAMGIRFLRMLCLGGGAYLLHLGSLPNAPGWMAAIAVALLGAGGFIKVGDKNLSSDKLKEFIGTGK